MRGARAKSLSIPRAHFLLVADMASRQLIVNVREIKKHSMIRKVSETSQRLFDAPGPLPMGPTR